MRKHHENMRRNEESQWKDSEGKRHIGSFPLGLYVGDIRNVPIFITEETLS